MCVYVYVYIYIYICFKTSQILAWILAVCMRLPEHSVTWTLRLCAHVVLSDATGVREKNTPPEKKTLWKINQKNTKSGAEEELMPLVCRAKARPKGVFFHRHRYHAWNAWQRIHDQVCRCVPARSARSRRRSNVTRASHPVTVGDRVGLGRRVPGM